MVRERGGEQEDIDEGRRGSWDVEIRHWWGLRREISDSGV